MATAPAMRSKRAPKPSMRAPDRGRWQRGLPPAAMRRGHGEARKAAGVYHDGMDRHFQVFLEHDPVEKAWVAYVPALDHLSTFGDTREAALANAREAILGYLETAKKEGIELAAAPPPAELVEIAV